MFQKRFLSLGAAKKEVSFFRKKVIAFLVFACMSVNGFMPGSIEASRYSFVLMMTVLTQNVVSETFKKCNDSLAFVSNKISEKILEFLFMKSSDENFAMQKDAQEREDGNTANENAFPIRQLTVVNKKIKDDIKNNGIINFFMPAVKLFRLYHNYKIPDKPDTIIILMFLLFIIFIVRKKKYYENNLNNLNSLKKTRISA